MSDAALRELERLAATGDASDSLRYEEALARSTPGVLFGKRLAEIVAENLPSKHHNLGVLRLPVVADAIWRAETQRTDPRRSPRPGVSWGHSNSPPSAWERVDWRERRLQVVLAVATADCVVVGIGLASASGYMTPGAAWRDELWPWRIDFYAGRHVSSDPAMWLKASAKSWKTLRAWCGCDHVPQDGGPVVRATRIMWPGYLNRPVGNDRIHARRSEALAWAHANQEKGLFPT